MQVTILGGAAWNRMIHVDVLPDGRTATVHPRWHHKAIGGAGAGKALVVPDVQVVDANGAGDAFFAGVLFGELEGVSLERALRYGAVAAAMAVTSTELASEELDAEELQARTI